MILDGILDGIPDGEHPTQGGCSGSDFIVKQTNHASKQTKDIVKGVKECTALVQLQVKIDIANAHGLLLNRDYGNGLSGRYNIPHSSLYCVLAVCVDTRIWA